MATKFTPTENMYQILVRPLVTEKTTRQAEENWLAFEVAPGSTKPQIRKAVERLYGVEVTRINTLIQKGKTKGFRGVKGMRSDVKKAFIKLKDGQSIDLMAGVK